MTIDYPVEFRYVQRFVPLHSENVGVLEKVLQVRYLNQSTGVYFTAKEDRYTPWTDVPTVP